MEQGPGFLGWQSKLSLRPGNMHTEIGELKKECSELFGFKGSMLRQENVVYLTVSFIDGLKKHNVEIDRRVLADLAFNKKEAFSALAEKVKESKAA